MPDRKLAASGDGSDLPSLCFPCGYTNKSQIINIRSAIVGLSHIDMLHMRRHRDSTDRELYLPTLQISVFLA